MERCVWVYIWYLKGVILFCFVCFDFCFLAHISLCSPGYSGTLCRPGLYREILSGGRGESMTFALAIQWVLKTTKNSSLRMGVPWGTRHVWYPSTRRAKSESSGAQGHRSCTGSCRPAQATGVSLKIVF